MELLAKGIGRWQFDGDEFRRRTGLTGGEQRRERESATGGFAF